MIPKWHWAVAVTGAIIHPVFIAGVQERSVPDFFNPFTGPGTNPPGNNNSIPVVVRVVERK